MTAPLFCVCFAGWTSWLATDTPAGEEIIADIFAPHRTDIAPRPDCGLFLTMRGSVPRLRAVQNGQVWDLKEYLDSAPGIFTPLGGPSRCLYAHTWFGEEAALEVVDGELAIFRREHLPFFLQAVFLQLLQRERLVASMHAAVAAVEGRALVLVGHSGSGKSTLSWALHQQGADYFTDEGAFFQLPDHDLYPWPRDLRLRPGGLNALGSPLSNPSWHALKPNDPKCRVALPGPTQPCPKNRAALFFMNGFADAPTLQPLCGGEAARRLWPSIGYRDRSVFTRLEIAADLVNSYPCWSLTVGRPDETAALLADHVRSLS